MGRKHWEKEKLLVTSNFSFSRSVFKRLVSQRRQKVWLCGNGLKRFVVGSHEKKKKHYKSSGSCNKGIAQVWKEIGLDKQANNSLIWILPHREKLKLLPFKALFTFFVLCTKVPLICL